MSDIDFRERVHPFDQDAYEVTWVHDGHEHFVVVPRELLADGRAWLARHAERVDTQCAAMFRAGQS